MKPPSFPCGAVSDAPGDDFAESTIGPRETELINHAGCDILLAKADAATAASVDCYDNRRLHGALGGHRSSTRPCAA